MLFNKAWFQTINPAKIISGFCKVGVCPFDSTAIKPCTDTFDVSDEIPSTSTSGQSHHNDNIPCPRETENVEGSPQYNYLDVDVELFERRSDNRYDIYDDRLYQEFIIYIGNSCLYVAWLRHEHPDNLPDPLHLPNPTIEESLEIDDQVASDLVGTSAEAVTRSSLDSSSESGSLSSSLSSTRQLISELKD